MGFHLRQFNGVIRSWYAVRDRDGVESGTHWTRLGAWLAGVRLVMRRG